MNIAKILTFLLILIFVTSDLYGADPELPIPGTPDPNMNIGSSTGTLVAAALENMGYRAQEIVLKDLGSLIKKFGLLIYVGCFITAIFAFSLHGSYQTALWFLIAPAIFFLLIQTTTKEKGPKWELGTYPKSQQFADNEVEKILKETGDSGNDRQPKEVSLVFHKINNLSSSIVRNIVKVTLSDDAKSQMKFMTRSNLMNSFFEQEVRDGGLFSFAKATAAECQKPLEYARMIALGRHNPLVRSYPEYKIAEKDFCDALKERKVQFDGTSPGSAYFREVVAYMEKEGAGNNQFEIPDGADLNSNKKKVINEVFKKNFGVEGMKCNLPFGVGQPEGAGQPGEAADMGRIPLNCGELWCVLGAAVFMEATKEMTQKAEKNIPGDIDSATLTEIMSDIATMLKQPEINDLKKNPTGKPTETETTRTILECEKDLLAQGLTQTSGNSVELSIIPIVLSGHILRKAMQGNVMGDITSQFMGRAGVHQKPYNSDTDVSGEPNAGEVLETAQATARRKLNHQQADSLFLNTYYLAHNLPYVQGIILYILSLTFPFFAILALVPGRASGFFMWVALWMWAKLWDVGWAFIMVLDNILWNLMPISDKFNYDTKVGFSPISMFEVAFAGDPSYSLANYYNLLQLAMIGVPFVMGQVVLGSKKALAGVWVTGLSAMGGTLGGYMSDWTAVSEYATSEELRRENYKLNRAKSMMGSGQDPEYTRPDGTKGHGILMNDGSELSTKDLEQKSQQLKDAALEVEMLGPAYRGIPLIKQILNINDSADNRMVKAGGKVIGGLAGATGIGGVAAALLGSAAVPTLAASADMGAQLEARSTLSLKRQAHALDAKIMQIRADMYFYKAVEESEYQHLCSLRAFNGRIENWTVGDVPTQILQDIESEKMKADASLVHFQAKAVGHILSASGIVDSMAGRVSRFFVKKAPAKAVVEPPADPTLPTSAPNPASAAVPQAGGAAPAFSDTLGVMPPPRVPGSIPQVPGAPPVPGVPLVPAAPPVPQAPPVPGAGSLFSDGLGEMSPPPKGKLGW